MGAKRALQTYDKGNPRCKRGLVGRVNNIFFILLTIVIISCQGKGVLQQGPEKATLQGIWLYTEFDYLPLQQTVPVDGSGYIEKQILWLYNPTDDTITFMPEYDKGDYNSCTEILLDESGDCQQKKHKFHWYERRIGRKIYPRDGVLGYCIKEIPSKYRLNDSTIISYFNKRKNDLKNTVVVLKTSDEINTKHYRMVSFNKCDIYNDYLRSFESLNRVIKILPDSTFKTNDTLLEYYWNNTSNVYKLVQ